MAHRHAGTHLRLHLLVLLAVISSACGTRLDDAAIESVALVGGANGGDTVAAPAGTAPVDAETSSDVADAAATRPTSASTTAPTTSSGQVDGSRPSATGGATTEADDLADEGPAGGDADTAAPPPGNETDDGGEGPAPSQPQQANKSPVVIGHFGTYSGLIGAVLNGGRETAQVWAQSVNARGGLNGHPVEIVTADDQGDPARAMSIARDMVENRGAIAFVGNLTPLSTPNYAPYLEELGIPVVGGSLFAPEWYTSPILFPQGPGLAETIAGGIRLGISAAGAPETSYLACVEAQVCQQGIQSARDGGAVRAGADLVHTADISLAQPNFTRECLDARNAGAQSLFFGAEVGVVSRTARDCFSQGYRPQLAGVSLAAVDSARSDPNLEGLIISSPTFPFTLADESTAEFRDAMATYAPQLETSGSASSVWTSGKLLEEAARSLPEEPTPADVIAGLEALPAGFTIGGLGLPPDFSVGVPRPRQPCYFVVQLVGGEFTAPRGGEPDCLPS